MHGEWSPGELRAALAAIQDQGLGQGEIAKLAGVNRSQVNRWARGENRPTYDKALRLARRIGVRHPGLAAALMAASGYTWDGVTEPEPEPEQAGISDKLRGQIEAEAGDLAPEMIAAVERILARERGEEGPSSGQGSTRRAG